jgi:hypothetical protein
MGESEDASSSLPHWSSIHQSPVDHKLIAVFGSTRCLIAADLHVRQGNIDRIFTGRKLTTGIWGWGKW